MKRVTIYQFGGPEVMKLEEAPTPVPSSRETRVKVEAAGVNFIDIYQRSGLYKGTLPLSMGLEGAGTVEATAPDVTEVKVGDRVVWTSTPGSYATHAVVPAERLVVVPPGVTFAQAAAAMLQGMTAQYLTHDTYPIRPGDTCLVHAAAGGVGLLLCQMAEMRGARVIGTVSTSAKAAAAREAGATDVILYTEQDFEAEVKRLTAGRGVNVVYDSVGKDTFEKSLNCLALRGYMVLVGTASGVAPSIDPQSLWTKGSIFLTRPSLFHYTTTRAELLERAGAVLGWIAEGKLRCRIDRTYPLAEAAAAHRALAERTSTGKLLLVP